MPNYQQVTIIGHVGRDPDDLRHVGQKNTAVTQFSVAVTTNKGRQNEHTEWFNVTAWGKTAEICSQYVRKGGPVMVVGKLKTDKWQDDAGNERITVKLHADNIQLLGSKQGSGNQQSEKKQESPHNNADDFDDDIPF